MNNYNININYAVILDNDHVVRGSASDRRACIVTRLARVQRGERPRTNARFVPGRLIRRAKYRKHM